MDRSPSHLGAKRSAAIVALAALTLCAGLGVSRLTPHEAIGATTAREMIASGDWIALTIDGRPWLEKPPLGTWAVAASGWLAGGVTEASSRLPSALAAIALCLGVGSIAARRSGPTLGLLAGAIQATTPWLIVRGRLAEADVMLAAMVVGAMAALDRARSRDGDGRATSAFFLLFGATALAKGIGFGAVLVGSAIVVLLVWDRDTRMFRALASPIGAAAALLIALAWPLLVLARHPETLGLWAIHVSDRLSARPSRFAGEGWAEYLLAPIVQTLPWTPLAALGAWRSAKRAIRDRRGLDRLLWAWAVVPASLVSLASVRNGHYLIYALPPASIWAAGALQSVGETLQHRRGWTDRRLRRSSVLLFAGLGLAWAGGFLLLGKRLNPRDAEFAFYERAGRLVRPGEPLILLYDLERRDRWDKDPYPTPFGPVPADLAARLYYLDRPATWRRGIEDLTADLPEAMAVIGRDRDLVPLSRLGRVAVLARGPATRWDRAFVLFRVETQGRDRRATPPPPARPTARPWAACGPGAAGR